MSHEVENMISAKGILPWHELGVVTPKDLVNAQEIIEAIGFDFKVEKRPNQTHLMVAGRPQVVTLRDSFSTVRVNKDGSESVLCGRVGRDYTPIQNTAAFGFFDHVVGAGEAIYETAGILKAGRSVFLLAALPEYIKILGSDEDKIKKFVLLANWHDGTSSLLAMFTDVRVVCNNTLNAALRSAVSQVAIRHTASAEERMKEASRTMGLVNQYNKELERAFNSMAVARMSADDLVKYVETLLPMPEKKENEEAVSELVVGRIKERRELVMKLAEVGHGAQLETTHGTVWGAYNAYTEFVDHASNFRSADTRALSILTGPARANKQKAFDLAVEYSERLKPMQSTGMSISSN
jgi:phage/plasmid-like protein (TIGR03299 family)